MEEKRDIETKLAVSLKGLVTKIPFEKITIKQIADGAGVIRVTFYNHFQDKYDLLAWIVRREILDPVRILIFSNFLQDKEFYMHAVRIEGQNSFSEIVEECAYALLLDIFRENGAERRHPAHAWMNPENLAHYYGNSMSYIVLEWIRTGMTIPPEEMATIYEYIGTRSMWDMLEEI